MKKGAMVYYFAVPPVTVPDRNGQVVTIVEPIGRKKFRIQFCHDGLEAVVERRELMKG